MVDTGCAEIRHNHSTEPGEEAGGLPPVLISSKLSEVTSKDSHTVFTLSVTNRDKILLVSGISSAFIPGKKDHRTRKIENL